MVARDDGMEGAIKAELDAVGTVVSAIRGLSTVGAGLRIIHGAIGTVHAIRAPFVLDPVLLGLTLDCMHHHWDSTQCCGEYAVPFELDLALLGLDSGLYAVLLGLHTVPPLELNSVPLGWTWNRIVHSVTVLGAIRAGLGTVCSAIGTVHGVLKKLNLVPLGWTRHSWDLLGTVHGANLRSAVRVWTRDCTMTYAAPLELNLLPLGWTQHGWNLLGTVCCAQDVGS